MSGWAGRTLQAAIFDMDGLLIDSEPLWRLAEQKVFRAVDLELTEAMCMETTGLRTDAVVDYWYQRHPWSDPSPEALEAMLIERVRQLMLERGESLPGVDHALGACRAAGLRLGLASSSAPVLIDAALERIGLSTTFEVQCSALHEEHGKPDPAVYLTAARRLGVEPTACLALEDSVPGVAAARTAGMVTVAVPAAEQRDDPGFEVADRVLGSLLDFELTATR